MTTSEKNPLPTRGESGTPANPLQRIEALEASVAGIREHLDLPAVQPVQQSGAILTAIVSPGSDGGLNYREGDKFSIVLPHNAQPVVAGQLQAAPRAIGVVDSVSPLGSVLGFHLLQGGRGYIAGSRIETLAFPPCAGSGLIIDILTAKVLA